MNVGFERIAPAPTYTAGTSRVALLGREWTDRAVVVEAFKAALKSDLRTLQKGRCCFCRRILFDDYATHLEHFIEKAQYAQYTFEIQNLALSCGTCNIQKNAQSRSLLAYLRMRANRGGKAIGARCQTLVSELPPGSPLPLTAASYRWVHPYFDDYSDNIRIERGWIFVGRTVKGVRTIRGVRLNALALVERRALVERLESRDGRLAMLVGAMAELNQHRATEVAAAVARVLRRRRVGAPSSP